MHTQLQQFLKATWQSPVFDDTFLIAADDPKMFRWAEQQLGTIAQITARELVGYVSSGMPELQQQTVQEIVTREILPKTLAFCPALTVGEIDDTTRLAAVSTAVGLMYWGDQTMDRGDDAMAEAIMRLPSKDEKNTAKTKPSVLVQARLGSLRHIEEKIKELAKPEDAPLVLACFYDQVLRNEVRTRRLSLDYLAANNNPAFISKHGRVLAELSTTSAGFPSIASSLYAIYRQHDASLPPLTAIYNNQALTNFLQTCNVVVRIWDDLGDWKMDQGVDPRNGEFVINPFNQYDHSFVERFCERAFIDDSSLRQGLQQHFAAFHASDAGRHAHETYVLTALRDHIRNYVAALTTDLPPKFQQYITLCKRVMEIGYVNRVGDVVLMNATPGAR